MGLWYAGFHGTWAAVTRINSHNYVNYKNFAKKYVIMQTLKNKEKTFRMRLFGIIWDWIDRRVTYGKEKKTIKYVFWHFMSFQKCILLILLHTWITCKSFQRCFWVLWVLIPSDRDPAHIPRWAGLPCDHHWLVYGRLLGWYRVDGMPGAAWWLREVGLVWDLWLAHMSTAGGGWHCSVWYDQRYVDVRNVRSQRLCRSSSIRARHRSLLPNRQSCEKERGI